MGKTANIPNYLDTFCKNSNAIAAAKLMESAARYIYDYAETLTQGPPSQEFISHFNFLHAISPKLGNKDLDKTLELLSSKIEPSSNKITLDQQLTSFLNNSSSPIQNKIEALTEIAQENNIPPQLVQKAINENPALQGSAIPQPQHQFPQPQYVSQPGMVPQPMPGMYQPAQMSQGFVPPGMYQYPNGYMQQPMQMQPMPMQPGYQQVPMQQMQMQQMQPQTGFAQQPYVPGSQSQSNDPNPYSDLK